MEKILYKLNPFKTSQKTSCSFLNHELMNKAYKFHQTIPGYAPTPLYSLSSLAKHLGINEILVKDESPRFGLNSFKGLGGSYALANYLSKSCGKELSSFKSLKNHTKNQPMQTFASATEGNHGRGLAWAAQQFGQKAFIFMPKGASISRVNKIRAFGANIEVTDLNYDDTVRYVNQLAEKNGWVLVQDTSWKGYQEIPAQIMQGYLTIVAEWLEQQKEQPTHVILQVGVGSFAAAIAVGLQQVCDKPIVFIIVEPTRADCFYQSACSLDGNPKNASGDLSTIMNGLSCGDPNPVAWGILKNLSECFITCPDSVAARGMRILGNPLKKDPRIVAGESGAIPLGLLYELCKNPQLAPLKNSLQLDSDSRVLFISTEGDTDPDNYRAVCWDGRFGN
ncbi:MAG: diaminopropionate ammonia-lyase [Parachlamydiaceae bacterium]|nr:diaminopropionate ammonia-lyase [Parachlamydiaceae bacterium]